MDTLNKEDIEDAFTALNQIKLLHLAGSDDAWQEYTTVFKFICKCNDSLKEKDADATIKDIGINYNKTLHDKWKRDNTAPSKGFWRNVFKFFKTKLVFN